MRTARAVPNVNVSGRHRPDCKWSARDGKKAAPERLTCDCPKMLTWYRAGKLHRQTADVG
jgi:hypothetical protein